MQVKAENGYAWRNTLPLNYPVSNVPEYSLASRTMALNIAELNWDEQLINAAELSPSLFSPLVRAGEAIGTVTSGVSRTDRADNEYPCRNRRA